MFRESRLENGQPSIAGVAGREIHEHLIWTAR